MKEYAQLKPPISLKGRNRFFVYGTLKTGHGNNDLMVRAGGQRVGYDVMRGPFAMVDIGGIPGVVVSQDAPQTDIFGELWVGGEDLMNSLDILEGHPKFYKRVRFTTERYLQKSWIYTLDKGFIEKDNVIKDGLWLPTEAEKTAWSKINA